MPPANKACAAAFLLVTFALSGCIYAEPPPEGDGKDFTAYCGASWDDDLQPDAVPFARAEALAPGLMANLSEPDAGGKRTAATECTDGVPEPWQRLAAEACPPWVREDRASRVCHVGVEDAPWGDGTIVLGLFNATTAA